VNGGTIITINPTAMGIEVVPTLKRLRNGATSRTSHPDNTPNAMAPKIHAVRYRSGKLSRPLVFIASFHDALAPPYCLPMRSISFWMASRSSDCSGKLRNSPIGRSSARKASRNARSISSREPWTTAGSGMPPVRRNRLSRPDWACFVGGVVADGEDEVHLGRAGLSEFVPTLAASIRSRELRTLQFAQRLRSDCASRMTARTVSVKSRLAPGCS
jgi:hypothetical protein